MHFIKQKLRDLILQRSQTDKEGFSTLNADEERDLAAKGGPMTGPGQPDDKHAVPTLMRMMPKFNWPQRAQKTRRRIKIRKQEITELAQSKFTCSNFTME